MTRVLITGAAGRLGSAVADRFHREDFELVATDVLDPGEVPYEFRVADLRDHHEASSLLAGIDVVLHIGNHPGIGARPPQEVFNENISMNQNMFQGAAEQGVRQIVFASTLQLIGSHPDERTVVHPPAPPTFPISGETTPTPSNVYALSKTMSETMLEYYAKRCGLDTTALRFPLLHNHDDWVTVGTGDERPTDLFEGFTGLTYHDAAELFLCVVRAPLRGHHVFMAGTAHRHRDLEPGELAAAFYPGSDDALSDLIDLTAVTQATGWRPSPDYRKQGD